ncbi:hypothetical protein [Haliea sp. E17]|uniref:hypothetical protein n=1 Tax=Haliea sp. E17 TaxID=3401576 RepID=UPI003AAFF246
MRFAVVCLLLGAPVAGQAATGSPIVVEQLLAQVVECFGSFGRLGGESAYLSASMVAPQVERLFSLRAVFGVLGTGLLTAAFIAPTALLADWGMRRRSDKSAGEADA